MECDTCAFREGSTTHDAEPYNRLRSEICALTGVPFFCHHGLNWRKPMIIRRGMAADVDGNIRRLQICAGWKARMNGSQLPRDSDNLSHLGRIVRRSKGLAALDLLEEACDSENDASDKAGLWERLRRVVKSLRRPFSVHEKVTIPR